MDKSYSKEDIREKAYEQLLYFYQQYDSSATKNSVRTKKK